MTALEKAILLQSTEEFHQSPPATLSALAAIARVQNVEAGARIFAHSTPADAFYTVVSGTVRCGRGGAQREHGRGEVFGLWSAFDGDLRPATAVAASDVELLRIDYAELRDLVLDSLYLGEGVYRVLARRIEEAAR